MAYDTLRTLAFRFASDKTDLPRSFATLAFPEEWKPALREATGTLLKRNPEQVRIPVRSLNHALRALVPELISIARDAGLSGNRPWLYATRALSREALFLICHAWVEAEFATLAPTQRGALLQQMQAEHLQWQEQEINLASWSVEANGTATLDQVAFVVLPDLLAAGLTQEGVSFEYGPEPLRFRRSPAALGTAGAELMSWPPRWFQVRRGEWAYSVTLDLTLQTVPFQPFPVVYCNLGLRRWVSVPSIIPGGQTSVYLQTQVPWLAGLPYSSSFQAASVQWRRSGGGEEWGLEWASKLTTILNALRTTQQLPNPQQLNEEPGTWLRGEGFNAAIVYRNGMTPSHGVQAGLMPGDRHPLAEQIAAQLAPDLEFVPTPTRVVVKGVRLRGTPFQEKGKALKGEEAWQAAARRRAIALASDGHLELEIRYQNSAIRDALLGALCTLLGWQIPASGDGPFQWQSPELTCTLTAYPLGRIGSELVLDPQLRNETDRLQRAIERRVREVAQEVTPAVRVSGTLIELPAEYKNEDEDPKHALRLGFARIRRLTQFITPPASDEDNLTHRAAASVLDLLRQFGVSPGIPEVASWATLPNVVGLWLVKQFEASGPTRIQTIVPILVLIRPDGQVQATASGLAAWKSYSEALLAIAQGKARGVRQVKAAMPLVRQLLEEDVLGLGDTLLLCDAVNIRQAWPALSNKAIQADSLALEKGAPKPITSWPGLRVIRLRSGEETPQWYAIKEEDYGFAKGLFQIAPRVYASVHEKPPQFTISPRLSKAGPWTNTKSAARNPEPHTYAWNPGLFELTIVGLQPGDKAEEWATFVHTSRQGAIQYGSATAQPMALHLATLMKEYMLPLATDEEEG